MTPASQLSQVRHSAWKRALFPLAKAALERKDYGNIALIESEAHLESLAWTVANYAATDMVMRKRTPLLDMDEVRAVDPFNEATGRGERPCGSELAGFVPGASADIHEQAA